MYKQEYKKVYNKGKYIRKYHSLKKNKNNYKKLTLNIAENSYKK